MLLEFLVVCEHIHHTILTLLHGSAWKVVSPSAFARERQSIQNKIRTILNIAIKFGHINMILSAFGFGAFHNPPLHVANLFKEILLEEPYKGASENVIFSINRRFFISIDLMPSTQASASLGQLSSTVAPFYISLRL